MPTRTGSARSAWRGWHGTTERGRAPRPCAAPRRRAPGRRRRAVGARRRFVGRHVRRAGGEFEVRGADRVRPAGGARPGHRPGRGPPDVRRQLESARRRDAGPAGRQPVDALLVRLHRRRSPLPEHPRSPPAGASTTARRTGPARTGHRSRSPTRTTASTGRCSRETSSGSIGTRATRRSAGASSRWVRRRSARRQSCSA